MERQAMLDAHYQLRDRLPMWVIYDDKTIDYPGVWVTRMHLSLPKPAFTTCVMTGASLEEVRRLLPPGLHPLARNPKDDPRIVEVWL